MKSFAKFSLVFLAALALAASAVQAQTNDLPASPNKAPARAPRPKPYSGVVASVDATAKTIPVTLANGSSQTMHVTAKTRFRKDGQPATLADATAGIKIRGSAHKEDSGDWIVHTVTLGEPKAKPAAAPP